MAKTLKLNCTPRKSVFESQRRDTVLSIKDLLVNNIEPAEFFEENFITEGMHNLLEQGFKRLEGKSEQGIFLLKQAMGGGKTHNLLTFGLLAQYPEFRHPVMGGFYNTDPNLGQVKVIAFNGRETDYPLGLWGSLADQLGKKELFNGLYSPLQAPGQTAWENLLKGETLLILIDELPPYLFNASSTSIGNSDLSKVTTTAITNLLSAVNSSGCERVALVLTDLSASYEIDSQKISQVLKVLENETNRSAMPLEPVNMGSDELYNILRKRIFETTPNASEISKVAAEYAKSIREAKMMDITTESPENFAARIEKSYPFHPAIRDLYARFKENPGFQQTRGLIRLMRNIVARMYKTNEAANRYLISPHDLDFNDPATRTELTQINSTLTNAIAHDIASDGAATAELLDKEFGNHDASDICRLLLISSLSNVENAVLGLSISDLVTYLAEPKRDLALLKTNALERLTTEAWYMHSDRDGKLFFKNTENLVARLEGLVKAYDSEQAIKELRSQLEKLFKPNNSWCYQKLLTLPALDNIELTQDQVTLIILQPYSGGKINPDVQKFFDTSTYKNRVGFLTGSTSTFPTLIENGKRLRAIKAILDEYTNDRKLDSDPLMVEAHDKEDKYKGNFYSAVRETFTTLLFPLDDNGSYLEKAEISMQFEANKYDGESQIKDLLLGKGKFEENIDDDNFRKKIEQRLFTQQSMQWNEIKHRAAISTKWQWHIPNALDSMRDICLNRDTWRVNGNYIDKGPFDKPKTIISVRLLNRVDDTGTAELQVKPLNGDQIYYDIGAQASTASRQLSGATYKTDEMKVSFLAVDSTGEHETGAPYEWHNTITLKYRFFQDGAFFRCELHAAPGGSIRYTTDGSNPEVSGAAYDSPFLIPDGSSLILAVADKDGISSDVLRTIPPKAGEKRGGYGPVQVDPVKPVTWKREQHFDNTQNSYLFLEQAKNHHANLGGITIDMVATGGNTDWLQLSFESSMSFSAEQLLSAIDALRALQPNGQVSITCRTVQFTIGKDLTDWVAELKTTLKHEEVEQ